MSACPLTPRQFQVLKLVMSGLTYQQAGVELGIAHSTVRSHIEQAYTRLDVHNIGQACALMLRNDWVAPEDILSDYDAPQYTTRRMRKDEGWLPTPAQRLYLDAFDVLLRERTDEAAARVAFYMAVMCQEKGVPVRRRGCPDIDDTLLSIAVCVLRPIPLADAA